MLSKRIKKRLKKAAGTGHGRPIKKSLFDELLNLFYSSIAVVLKNLRILFY